MAGLIRREDIDEVRSRTDIREIVEGYVTLKGAGIGSFKGLCPFHDERTPSFHVRPQMGTYHCFGCGESGDVIAFVMAMDHTSFTETVEKLAARINYELHYEAGQAPDKRETGKRQRLLDAHKVAAEFFQRNLYTPAASEAQKFMGGRGFDPETCKKFGVGYAPKGWDNLLTFLRSRGFTDDELRETGMFSEGNRGLYDRFRGRVVWPIRALGGETIGFGARRLYEDDKGPKYLNTPETPLYKKSQVLYGIDLAKRNIAKKKQIVVVEGYTDVMAAHVAGIDTAVATSGTAFGEGHIKIIRRLMGDDGSGGEVIFTFDGDAAGQKAALSAFEDDQRFVAQTFVAVAASGMDPCDLRLEQGDAAVRALVKSRRPLFEFAIDATLRTFDLTTVEGRVRGMRAIAPIVAGIKDSSLRPAYIRRVSGQLGLDIDEVQRAVSWALQNPQVSARERARLAEQTRTEPATEQAPATGADAFEQPDMRDPVARMEREALEIIIQCPQLLGQGQWQELAKISFRYSVHAALGRGIIGAAAQMWPEPGATWVNTIRAYAPEPVHPLLAELTVAPIPASTEEQLARYARDILNRLFEQQINRQKSDLLMEIQRLNADAAPEEFQRIQRELMQLEIARRRIMEGQD
ncbi:MULTISPECIES: DNA primase [unclassified Rothia (in: high G+C Gram-positive bacteria)]|uniref:DNA primase n=1 Tax=unclassified Rothia (in: high G+C Gram-positive bacteria) TaxID=2689056 RepID=UPI00195742D1|nr:DNA primase [Rothia sp. ZJ932]MBM7051341.1 DNA primase [Rothia sp. ZJ1223]QRZ61136.1 DNA primase [Rothia sp. ZJ932]